MVGPLSPKSDWLLISPYNVTFESNGTDGKYIENSGENMHTDVTVWGVKGERPNWIPLSSITITDQTVQ